MKIKNLLLFLFFISVSSIAQTLSPGDIAIIGYNSDNPDALAFVCLVDVSSGTQINFTDNGWLNAGNFRSGEGKFTYTFDSDVAAGTIINPTISGVAFATGGDQVFIYQGADESPSFIFGFNNEGAGVWQADATNSNTSSLPASLVNGESAVAINEIDNTIYSGINSGTKAELLAAICNKSNWLGNDTLRQTMPTGSFTVTGGGTTIPDPPVAIAATNITYNSFSANWNSSAGATSYLLDVSENSGFSPLVSGYNNLEVGNVTTYSVVSLNSNTPYYYRVRAKNSAGTSENSDTINVTTLNTPNTTVQFLSASNSVSETSGTFNLTVTILNPDAINATSANIVLINGDSTDIDNYTTQTVTFPAGSSANQVVPLTIVDDGITEGNETLTFEIQNVTGGNSATAGNPSQFALTIIENNYGNYYDPITPGISGDQLHFELHNLIKGHIEYPYSSYTTDVWDILMDADEDPENSNNVILIYTGRSQDKNYNQSVYGTNDPDAWNREHVWAKSRGDFGEDPPAGSDAHHLKPADNTMNSTRSNKDFDNGGNQVFDNGTTPTDCYTDVDSWEPRDEVKGDVARMLFYMDVRYEGEKGEPELHLVDYAEANPDTDPEIGVLSTLLQWHQQDPPDAFEINRNNIVFSYQQNRNPFIDHPEWVDEIWGSNAPISPTIANVTKNIKIPNHDQDLIISADITDNGSVATAELRFRIDNGQEQSINMTFSGGNTYTGTISESLFGNGNFLSFYVYAEDNESNPKYGTINELFTGTTNISTIHSVDVNGRLTYDGVLARVTGVATVGSGTFSTSNLDVFIQDETGGISIFKAGDSTTVITLGNDYTVTGNIDMYKGKTEIVPENSSIDIVNNGNGTLPKPFEMTLAQLSSNAETMEGRLVLIPNLSKVSGTWTAGGNVILSDDGGVTQITLHIDSSTDLGANPEPVWPKDVTGIYSQYDDFYPYINDYQILPRIINDISNSVTVQLKIYLEGCYNSTENNMTSSLSSVLPLKSPYSEDPRSILSMPSNIVDWVLVELRSDLNGPAVLAKSALLRNNGQIVADDGILNTLRLSINDGDYYIVIKHRNHLPIMSPNKITLSNN